MTAGTRASSRGRRSAKAARAAHSRSDALLDVGQRPRGAEPALRRQVAGAAVRVRHVRHRRRGVEGVEGGQGCVLDEDSVAGRARGAVVCGLAAVCVLVAMAAGGGGRLERRGVRGGGRAVGEQLPLVVLRVGEWAEGRQV